MSDIQRIHLPTHEHKTIFSTYQKQTKQELLTVLGGDGRSLQGLTTPTNQLQEEGRVGFDTREIATATRDLEDAGHMVHDISFVHNHNRASGHAFDFSKDDLQTAKNLHDTYGIDRMGLVMNGHQTDHIAVQHVVMANHQGELHDVETDAGVGKVVTMIADKNGGTKQIVSDSIAEAESIEAQIAQLKDILNADDAVHAIAA